MKLLRTIDIKLSSVKLPGDYKSHLDPTVIAELARTIQESANTNGDEIAYGHSGLPPVVLDQGHKLRAGRNRFVAAKEAGVKTIRADVIEFTSPAEAEILELKENLHRKQLDADVEAKLTARLVELVTDQVEAERAAESATELPIQKGASKPGKAKSAKGEAIERVAAAAGITRQGVEKRLERAEQAEAPAAPAAPPVTTWGVEAGQPDAWTGVWERANAAQLAMDAVSKACTAAVGAISLHLPEGNWQAVVHLKEQLHQLGRVARALRPEAVCPFCKALVQGCPSCGGRGLVGQGEIDRAPDELKLEGERAMVCIGPNEIVPLAKGKGRTFGQPAAGPTRKGKAAAPAEEPKQIQVVDEFGNPIPF